MDSAKLNDWMQVVGIFAVVASLVFVGLQMKQSQEIAIADQYQARAEAAQAMYMSVLESGQSWESLDIPWEQKSPEERSLQIAVMNWSWTQYDNHYFQYLAGFLDEESWDGLRGRIEQLYSFCDGRPAWEGNRRFFRASFVEYVESLDDPCN
jgi:hypothetical protein